jgi:hypothetical protein
MIPFTYARAADAEDALRRGAVAGARLWVPETLSLPSTWRFLPERGGASSASGCG